MARKNTYVIASRAARGTDKGGTLRINSNKTLNQVRKQMVRIAERAQKQYQNSSDGRAYPNSRISLGYNYGTYSDALHGGSIDAADNVALGIFGDIRGNGNRTMGDLQKSGDFNSYMKKEAPYERLSLRAIAGSNG